MITQSFFRLARHFLSALFSTVSDNSDKYLNLHLQLDERILGCLDFRDI